VPKRDVGLTCRDLPRHKRSADRDPAILKPPNHNGKASRTNSQIEGIVKEGGRTWLDRNGVSRARSERRSDAETRVYTPVSALAVHADCHKLATKSEWLLAFWTGYTLGMKTAVSIPDEVFEKVERLARRAGRSRSEVFSAALAEYVARHAPDEVTEAMDRVCAEVGNQEDAFVSAAARHVLENTEW
jgi:Ribbon-helix-helix protein, copG family